MSKDNFHLVHANIAVMRAPLDDPRMADFVAQAGAIDAIAQASPGFIAQPTPPDEGTIYTGHNLLNLSMWESVESLEQFTYANEHALALQRRAEWFEQYPGPNYVLFWFPAGRVPTEVEIQHRIDYLRTHGETPYVFTFERRFTIRDTLAFDPS
ncbi:MAG TPA: DUF3291 domain-containing protein [Anaerolineales bacterium]